MRKLVLVSMVLGPLCSLTHTAYAAWSAAGNGSAAGGAYVMPAGNPPTGTVRSTSVGLSWSPASLPNNTPVAGYVIHRYDSNGNAATVGGTCAGVVASTTCTETVTPGTWTYTDAPVQFSWTGPESPHSSRLTVSG